MWAGKRVIFIFVYSAVLLSVPLTTEIAEAKPEGAAAAVRRIAEALGDPSAQFALGNMYAHGQQVEKDMHEAAKWFRKAAEQGHLESQFRLGELYLHGQGVRKDQVEAASWLGVAAEGGHPEAQYDFAEMHRLGLGMRVQPKEARRWYLKAARHDLARARFQLGVMCRDEIISCKGDEAERWFKQAADQGLAEAAEALKALSEPQKEVVDPLPPDPLAEDRALADQGDADAQFRLAQAYAEGDKVEKDADIAHRWLLAAARNGNAEAQYRLARHYGRGSTPEDRDEAEKWLSAAAAQGHRKARLALASLRASRPNASAADRYRLAAEQNDADAQLALARLYLTGSAGVAKEPRKAAYWLKRATKTGLAEAQYQLGLLYLQGLGVNKSLTDGLKWLRRAAGQGHGAAEVLVGELDQVGLQRLHAADAGDPEAQYEIAETYLGSGDQESAMIAIQWLSKAAQQGNAQAQVRLGEIYRDGQWLDSDPDKAFQWFRKAAQQGHAEAEYQLGEMYAAGNGVARDKAEASRWYRRAARQGNSQARDRLGGCLMCD